MFTGCMCASCAQIIAQTAKFVREAGGQTEFVLSVRQAGNPNFCFLTPTDRLHPYYRWLVRVGPQEPQPLAQEAAAPPAAAQQAAEPVGASKGLGFRFHEPARPSGLSVVEWLIGQRVMLPQVCAMQA